MTELNPSTKTIVISIITVIIVVLFIPMPFWAPLAIIGLFIAASKVTIYRKVDMKKFRKRISEKDAYRREPPRELEDILPLMMYSIYTPITWVTVIEYYISKWTLDGVLEHIKTEEIEITETITITKRVAYLRIHEDKLPEKTNQLERHIFKLIIIAAGEDGVLTTDEIEDKIDQERLKKIMIDLRNDHMNNLIKKGYAKEDLKGFPYLTEECLDLIYEHADFYRYLKDYTIIKNRGAKEIEMWDTLFSYATLYGLTFEYTDEIGRIEFNTTNTSGTDIFKGIFETTLGKNTYKEVKKKVRKSIKNK